MIIKWPIFVVYLYNETNQAPSYLILRFQTHDNWKYINKSNIIFDYASTNLFIPKYSGKLREDLKFKTIRETVSFIKSKYLTSNLETKRIRKELLKKLNNSNILTSGHCVHYVLSK